MQHTLKEILKSDKYLEALEKIKRAQKEIYKYHQDLWEK